MRSRFAPSPTGQLHLGHAYAAKFAHDLAQQHRGEFLLRFEDIDVTRVRDVYYSSILEDLKWLGMAWNDEVIKQSQRGAAYSAALEQLKQQDLVYPCFCTRKQIAQELTQITNAPHGPEGVHYPKICKSLSLNEQKKRIESGEIPAWRFDSKKAAQRYPSLFFTDAFIGKQKVNPEILGDIILARKDIGTSYHIAVVVDDAMQKITHVSRGNDLLCSTSIHRVLQQALKLPEPLYAHHAMLCDEAGKRLAKRHAALSIHTLRNKGKTAQQVLQLVEKTEKK